MKKTKLYSRVARPGKRGAAFLLLLRLAALPAADAQAPRTVVIPRASQVALSRVGIHTHADYLLFNTGSLDIARMQADPAHFPHLTLHARCSLPTDRAALPPDLAAFSNPGDPPLPNPRLTAATASPAGHCCRSTPAAKTG